MEKFDEIIINWVHKNPNNYPQIKLRALLVAISPLLIGGFIGLIICLIIGKSI